MVSILAKSSHDRSKKGRKKKICSRYSFCLTRAGGFSKKIQKRHSDYISSKTRLGKAEKEEKNFISRTVSTWLGLKHSQNFFKKSKKIKKTKKCHSGSIFSQIGLGQAEKEKKQFSFRVTFLLDQGWSLPKIIQKKDSKRIQKI